MQVSAKLQISIIAAITDFNRTIRKYRLTRPVKKKR